MIDAVFLDVDDTLVDYQAAARAAFADATGSVEGYEVFHALDHYERFLRGEWDFRTARDTRMADFLRLRGRFDDVPRAAELEQVRFDALVPRCALFDDVLPLLSVLRARGVRIGLITNNESVHQRAKLAHVGLDRLVDAAVISGEVGVAKPDAAIFSLACEALDVAPSRAVHVGDNLQADAVGAHEAGLRAVWLVRDGSPDAGPLEFPVIRSLAALPPLLTDPAAWPRNARDAAGRDAEVW